MLAAHGTTDTIIGAELQQIHDRRLAKTANRSVVEVMNEFTYLAEVYRGDTPAPDLFGLTTRLATTPCGPSTANTSAPTANWTR